MKSTWQFRVVFKRRTFVAQRNGSPRVIEGTDQQALQFAAKVHAHFNHYDLQRVEAHLISEVDLKIPSAQDGRITYQLHKRDKGWQFDHNQHLSAAQSEDLDWLINLAAIRSRGYVCEIQIRGSDCCLERVALMNAEGDRFD